MIWRSGYLRYTLFILFFCINVPKCAFAQTAKGWSVEGSYHLGKIIRHSPYLAFDIPPVSTGFDLNISYQTYGRKPWNQWQKYPELGVSLMYYYLGNKEVLGNAFGFLPNLRFDLFRKAKLDMNFQLGAGVAYLDTPFDRRSNPTGNAIGSPLNVNIYYKFYASWFLHPQWTFSTGLSFTHFSNGASKLPNYGINIPALMLSAKYTPKRLQDLDFIHHDISKKSTKKFGFNAYIGIAFKETEATDGPSYPIRIASASATYHLNKVNRLMLGLEYEFNKAAYTFGKHVFAFNSEKEAKRRSTRYMLFLADEFIFGNLGLMIQAGIYVSKDPFLTISPIYNKLGVRYYLPPLLKNPELRFFLGSHLKSHKTVADYLAMDVGLTF